MGQVSISDCNGHTDNYTALHRVYTSQNINLTIALIPPLQMCFIQLNKQFLPLINKNVSVSPGSRQSNQLLCETNKKGYSPFQERGLCEKSFQPLCSQLTTGPLQQSGGIVNIFVNIMLIYQESNLL